MNLSSYTSPGRDQYNRKYPIKIVLINEKVLFGHIKSYVKKDDKSSVIHFLGIKNIDDWKSNINEENREVIILIVEEILKISIYKDY